MNNNLTISFLLAACAAFGAYGQPTVDCAGVRICDDVTWGVGVETGPGAMCCWEVTTNGATLVLDLRAGGQPVRLGGRTLKACRIVRAESREGETAWQFVRRFCRMMCPAVSHRGILWPAKNGISVSQWHREEI